MGFYIIIGILILSILKIISSSTNDPKVKSETEEAIERIMYGRLGKKAGQGLIALILIGTFIGTALVLLVLY